MDRAGNNTIPEIFLPGALKRLRRNSPRDDSDQPSRRAIAGDPAVVRMLVRSRVVFFPIFSALDIELSLSATLVLHTIMASA